MAVDREISREHIRAEMAAVEDLARTYGWMVSIDYEKLTVTVEMAAHNGDRYVIEMLCDDYKEKPPYIEFIDPETGARGTAKAYPKTHDSFFHTAGPCICAPFNRKAYKTECPEAPHGDWSLGDWQTSSANGVRWSDYSRLGDMLGLINTRLTIPEFYKGRLG